jgi:hypothetical protein
VSSSGRAQRTDTLGGAASGRSAGVRLESERSIRDLFTASEVLDAAGIERVTRTLAQALPPK